MLNASGSRRAVSLGTSKPRPLIQSKHEGSRHEPGPRPGLLQMRMTLPRQRLCGREAMLLTHSAERARIPQSSVAGHHVASGTCTSYTRGPPPQVHGPDSLELAPAPGPPIWRHPVQEISIVPGHAAVVPGPDVISSTAIQRAPDRVRVHVTFAELLRLPDFLL